MHDPSQPLALLNVYELVDEGVHRHFICFLDPALAGSRGIDRRSVIGEFTPGPDGNFDLESFMVNPAFLEEFTGYMNEVAVHSSDMNREAAEHAGGYLYVLDPRFRGPEGIEPEAADLLGRYAVDPTGRILPNSFIYNDNHQWFDASMGVSGVLSDRRFYDWLHSSIESQGD